MGLISTAENWLASVALRKTVVHVINVVVAWILAKGAVAFLEVNGVHIDQNTLQDALTVTLTAVLKMFRDWLALKTGWTWLG